jgi:hypothetical protein
MMINAYQAGLPWPKFYQLGVCLVKGGEGFVKAGDMSAKVCRTPSAWRVIVGVNWTHRDPTLLVMVSIHAYLYSWQEGRGGKGKGGRG